MRDDAAAADLRMLRLEKFMFFPLGNWLVE
jgi:hypothetical protein